MESGFAARDFVHLHVHSHYSLLDGNCQLPHLLDRVRESGQDAVALTDHGNLFGAISFYKECLARGIKPILGMEAYVASGSRLDRNRTDREGRRKHTFHATLLAADNQGFENLIRLASTAYVDGFYYRPRIDREAMREWGRGLICLSGCLAGEVNQFILADRMEDAERTVREYQEIFGSECFYLEVMSHGIPEEERSLEAMARLSGVTRAPLVATNDIHYVEREDWEAQDVALCIGTGRLRSDDKRFRMSTHELYFKDTGEMAALFSAHPQALRSTREIADRCNVELSLGNRFLPSFETGPGEDSETAFRRLCEEGARRRYTEVTPEVRERLDREVGVIVDMGFVDYFLIVWDFIRYSREQGIPVGPGRGSAAGSIVAYCLGITEVDPLEHGLLFERFLNVERISMPDIDIDFCKDRRGDVIDYVERKYGRDHVAQIITFGTMKARAVIRDVGRVLDIPLPEVDRIAKKIPNGPKDTLAHALENDTEVQALYRESDQARQLFDLGLKLEGNARHASIHAAGVVISDRPLHERVPLYRAGDDITTQWPCEILDEVGLLKMDFLGLRNLTIIKECQDNIAASGGTPPDMEDIPLDDPATYELLGRGASSGVFQLESEGMRDLLRRLRPDRFEDIVAVLALYRPGPLGSGMVDSFVRRKHGEEPITYPHPSLEGILEESLGVILYQEQVMRIANVLSGFSMNESDNLRKAMGKKKPEILAKFKEKFVDGAVQRGVEHRVAAEVFDLIEYFAGYGFNKSHSVAYAMITYRTAYLKANHPLEYMAALLSCEMVSIDKTVEYIEECRGMGIDILPPDVNASMARFAVEGGGIRFALAALRGVGEAAADALVGVRKTGGAFKDVFELCERVDVHRLNKTAMEALVHAGAMDSLEGNRAQKLAVLDEALAMGSAAARDRNSGQGSLFGPEELGPRGQNGTTMLPELPEMSEQERLQREKDVLGFYLTGHPLNRVRDEVHRFATAKVKDAGRLEGRKVILGGIVNKVRRLVIRRGDRAGQKMAVLGFEDFTGTIEAVVFADLYQQIGDQLREDLICFLEGEVDLRREEASFKVSRMVTMEEAPNLLTRKLTLRVDGGEELDLVLPAIRRVLRSHQGRAPVFFDLRTSRFGSVVIQAGPEYRVDTSGPLIQELHKLLGTDRVTMN